MSIKDKWKIHDAAARKWQEWLEEFKSQKNLKEYLEELDQEGKK